jgi:hypothetical protein
MDITKCLIWAHAVSTFTVAARALSQCAPAPAIRSLATATDELRELREDELDGVSGGLVVIAIIAIWRSSLQNHLASP